MVFGERSLMGWNDHGLIEMPQKTRKKNLFELEKREIAMEISARDDMQSTLPTVAHSGIRNNARSNEKFPYNGLCNSRFMEWSAVVVAFAVAAIYLNG